MCKEKRTIIRAEIDPDLKKVFEDICKAQDFTSSQVLRRMIKKYVQSKGQKELF